MFKFNDNSNYLENIDYRIFGGQRIKKVKIILFGFNCLYRPSTFSCINKGSDLMNETIKFGV